MKTSITATLVCAAFLVLGVVTWEQGRALSRLERENALLRGRITYLASAHGELKKNAIACLISLDEWVKEEKLLRKKN